MSETTTELGVPDARERQSAWVIMRPVRGQIRFAMLPAMMLRRLVEQIKLSVDTLVRDQSARTGCGRRNNESRRGTWATPRKRRT